MVFLQEPNTKSVLCHTRIKNNVIEAQARKINIIDNGTYSDNDLFDFFYISIFRRKLFGNVNG